MIYTARLRCPVKPNGIQKASKGRQRFDLLRSTLQGRLYDLYGKPETIDQPCRLLATFWFADKRHPDLLNALGGLEDSISVGKCHADSRRAATLLHPWPLLADDSLVVAFGPAPGLERMLILDAGDDAIQFSVEIV